MTQFTPGVPLTFAGGQNTIGPATYGIGDTGEPISGYFWNTYIYATISDHSGLTRNWRARQEATVFTTGTLWNGADPSSVVDSRLPPVRYAGPNEESPFDVADVTFHSSDLLAFIDSPGPAFPTVLQPYNYSKTIELRSWVELDGQRKCSKSWTVTLKWTNGQLTEWKNSAG